MANRDLPILRAPLVRKPPRLSAAGGEWGAIAIAGSVILNIVFLCFHGGTALNRENFWAQLGAMIMPVHAGDVLPPAREAAINPATPVTTDRGLR